jgi:hypothetical protein
VGFGRDAVEGEEHHFDPVRPDQSAGETDRDTGREGMAGGVGLVAGEDDGVTLVVRADEGVDQADGGGAVGPVDTVEHGMGLDDIGEVDEVVAHR